MDPSVKKSFWGSDELSSAAGDGRRGGGTGARALCGFFPDASRRQLRYQCSPALIPAANQCGAITPLCVSCCSAVCSGLRQAAVTPAGAERAAVCV